jgi:hypothetical protein
MVIGTSWSSRDAGVVAEQVHGLVEQAFPAVAAGVVGDLLVGEPGQQRRPEVAVADDPFLEARGLSEPPD